MNDGLSNHILTQFPWAVAIIDAYHVMERLAAYANERFGRGAVKSKTLYESLLRALLGKRHAKRHKAKPRQGGSRRRVKCTPAHDTQAGGATLLALIKDQVVEPKDAESHRILVGFIEPRLLKLNYPLFRHLSYQIGSGAMESLHRTGSQCRIKIPGGRWLEETSQAIFNFRMMILAGRWTSFWSQAELHQRIADAFRPTESRMAA